jgi:hypothetical protein
VNEFAADGQLEQLSYVIASVMMSLRLQADLTSVDAWAKCAQRRIGTFINCPITPRRQSTALLFKSITTSVTSEHMKTLAQGVSSETFPWTMRLYENALESEGQDLRTSAWSNLPLLFHFSVALKLNPLTKGIKAAMR